MTDSLTLDGLKAMLAPGAGARVSLFMPTHAAAPDNRADPLQLKTLLRDASAQLEARGTRTADAEALLAPARDLADDGLFWRPRPGGLAVYLSAEGLSAFRTGTALEPAAFVGERFHVRPVLASVDRGERFFVLALSQHLVRLYRGDRDALTEIDLGDMPRDIAEALRNDGFSEQLQTHSTGNAPVVAGHGAAMFHGSGGADTGITTRYLTEYVKRIAAGLRDLVGDRASPLVVAAVAELAVLYRDADREHAITAGIVAGNPEPLSDSDLHTRAWQVASAEFETGRAAVLERYREAAGTAHAAAGAEQVVPAAVHGRVGTLLLEPSAALWGRFDADAGSVEVHVSRQPGDDDLADLAAAATIINGGEVFTGEGFGAPLAAVLRY